MSSPSSSTTTKRIYVVYTNYTSSIMVCMYTGHEGWLFMVSLPTDYCNTSLALGIPEEILQLWASGPLEWITQWEKAASSLVLYYVLHLEVLLWAPGLKLHKSDRRYYSAAGTMYVPLFACSIGRCSEGTLVMAPAVCEYWQKEKSRMSDIGVKNANQGLV